MELDGECLAACLEALTAGRALVAQEMNARTKCRTFIFVNNPLEDSSLGIIAALLEQRPYAAGG